MGGEGGRSRWGWGVGGRTNRQAEGGREGRTDGQTDRRTDGERKGVQDGEGDTFHQTALEIRQNSTSQEQGCPSALKQRYQCLIKSGRTLSRLF